jgi:hypothetical protein
MEMKEPKLAKSEMIKLLIVPIGLLSLTICSAVSKEVSVVCQFTETHWEEALGRKAVMRPDPKDEFVITYTVNDASNNDEAIIGTYRNLRPGHPVAKLVGVSNPNKATLVESTSSDNAFVVTIFHTEKDARGLLAVKNLHSVAYGLHQSVGFCR